jgi:hypothetical protein
MLIGLDISSSIVGVSIFNDDNTLFDLRNIDLRKIDSFFKKADYVRARLQDIKCEITSLTKKVNIISVEECAQSFRKGFSSAQTLSTLARFNGVVSQIAYEIFCVEPLYYNVVSSRKSLGIKLDKSGEIDTKEQIVAWVSLQEPTFKWPTRILSKGKNVGTQIYEVYCYDMADAYVIGKIAVQKNAENNNGKA